MHDFSLLKEFLHSGKTQRDFSKAHKITPTSMGIKLRYKLMDLLKTNVIEHE